MEDVIKSVHGGGGEAMEKLLSRVLSVVELRKVRDGVGLDEFEDSAVIPLEGKNLVFTTDSYTVKPLFFPGGDIGKLSIAGTINDLAVMGAKPLAISTAFIIGEGFPIEKIERIVDSINKVSKENSVPIVTGDTKVIDSDIEMLINTSGIGIADRVIRNSGLREGDRIIVSGTVGDHGMAIMSKRKGIEFDTPLESDCAALWKLVEEILDLDVHAMKDPTRGGIANSLNELADKSGNRILIHEEEIPIREEVKAASEMLGIDPLTVANEGKILIGVGEADAEKVLQRLRKNPIGKEAEIIGSVEEGKGVIMETVIGGRRHLEKPSGDPVPRVC